MVVAEARAAWQRTTNRFVVQEDAKRAPKLACFPSSDASTKQGDSGPAIAADAQNYLVPGFRPITRNPSFANIPPNSRWWVQLQPNYTCQKGLKNEKLNTLEAERVTLKTGQANLKAKPNGVDSENDEIGAFVAENCTSCTKKELEGLYIENVKESLKVKEGKESCEFFDMDAAGSAGFKKSNEQCFESGSSWIGDDKSEPWWRTADRNELASFVAQKSLDLLDNCDLPQPRNKHVKMGPYSDHNGIVTSSVDWNPPTAGAYSPIRNNSTKNETTEMHIPDKDSSNTQLLEALRHSQTRAREAEKIAKQTHAEKEHLTKLFFKQASHLFAYKQWLQLLQLETLSSQTKNYNGNPMSTFLPAVLPRKMQKKQKKAAISKRVTQRRSGCSSISKYALLFALGLSLVGAGLFLGWTAGWMLPAE